MNAATLCAVLACVAVTAAAPPASAPVAGLIPLRVKLPHPIHDVHDFMRRHDGPEYDKPPDPNRVGLRVPRGVLNVAEGMPVTAGSRGEPINGSLHLVTDGDRDGGGEGVVELPPGPQWVQIDLGEPTAVHAVMLWHRFDAVCAYHDVIVQLSDDPTFTKGVTTLFNNDADKSAGLGKGADREYVESHYGRLIDGRGVKARYVRLYSRGSTADDQNHYAEVEVYGLQAPARMRLLALRDARLDSPEAMLAYFAALDPTFVRYDGGKVVAVTGPVRDARDLAMLSRMPTLRSIRVLPAGGWGPNMRVSLGRLPNLRALDLTGSYDLAAALLKEPAALASLEELHFSPLATVEGDTALARVRDLKRLRSLRLVPAAPEKLWLGPLAGMEQLESLSFAGSRVGDDAVLEAGRLPRLARLDLSGTPITELALLHLARDPKLLPVLRELDISACRVADIAVTALEGARPGIKVVRRRPGR